MKVLSIRTLYVLTTILSFTATGYAVNGKAVSVVGGVPMLITIQNTAVASSAALPMPAGTEEVKGPRFSFDGTQVVMFRRSGSSAWITIVSLQDMQVSDLVPVACWPKGGGEHLSWPIGDWIYYAKPDPSGDMNWKIFNQIWRVNVKDTSLDEYVYNYSPSGNAYGCWLKWWNCTADAKYATSMVEVTPSWAQNATFHCFPPEQPVVHTDPNFFLQDSFIDEQRASDCPSRTQMRTCNNNLSPGGNFFTHYSGWHGELWIEYWNKATGSYSGVDKKYGDCFENVLCNPEINRWLGIDPDDYDVGERPTFACNSEKWLTLQMAKSGWAASDVYLIDWIDKEAVRMTANANGNHASSGHFFVEGGPANAWEDTSGQWHALEVPDDSTLVAAPDIGVQAGVSLTTTQLALSGEVMNIDRGTGSMAYIFSPTQLTMNCPTAEAQIHYTTDGSDPTESSPSYGAAVPISSTTTVRARAFGSGSIPSYTRTAAFVAAREPDNPTNSDAGLVYSYYEGDSWWNVPAFDDLTPVASGVCDDFDLSLAQRQDNYAFKFEGYVDIPSDGVHTFTTWSDDGSKLYIGDQLVVNNDGKPWMSRGGSGVIGLKAGKHAIRVDYHDGGSDQWLEVLLNGAPIPAASLSRGPAATSLRRVVRTSALAPTVALNTAGMVTVFTSSDANVKVFDTKGSLVLSRSVRGNGEAVLPRMNAGYYHVVVSDGIGKLTTSIVVQH